jgi:uncharacterized Ntn-hydrolase superfamily protein
MKKIIFGIALVLMAGIAGAQHTFSICAVDLATGEVGSAGASCIENSRIISDVHPGVGVVHTQAYFIYGNQNYAEDLMNEGVSPAAIIDSMVANDIFDDPSFRQYGVVDLVDGGRSAAYTGENTNDWKGHITGPTYAIQGNILLGPEILDNMESNFNSTTGNLACKLMAALQGAKVPGADTRCLEFDISALSSFLKVAKADDEAGSFFLDIQVRDVEGDSVDPIDSLQTIFDILGGCNYTGINSISTQAPTIYPQPSTDVIIFQLDNNFDFITVFDVNGAVVFTKNLIGEATTAINCSAWQSGIYFYQLRTANGNTSGKIIVE